MYKYELGLYNLLAYLLELLDRGFDNDNIRLDIALLYNQMGLQHHAKSFTKTVPTPKAAVLLYKLRGVFPIPYPMPIEQLPVGTEPTGELRICSAASSDYFYAVVNLIGGLQQNSWDCIKEIVVYDLGMLRHQRHYLSQLAGVRVKKIPDFTPNWAAFFAWKFWIVMDVCKTESPGSMLYLDAGIDCQKPLTDILDCIKTCGYITWETGQPTAKWTSDYVYKALNLDKITDESTCPFSGLFGLCTSTESPFLKAIKTGYELALDEAILRPHSDCIDNRHDMSLMSACFNKHNDIVKTPMHPHIAGVDDTQQNIANSTLHVCRHGKIGLHDNSLRRR